MRAHIDQARARLEQIAAAGARWSALEEIAETRGWPDRLVIALEQGLFGGVDRRSYPAEAGVSAATATSDLRRLLDARLIDQHGRGRSTGYVATVELRRLIGRDNRR